MEQEREARSLMAYLEQIPDRRGRRGRRHCQVPLRGCWILAALNGQTALRGMGV